MRAFATVKYVTRSFLSYHLEGRLSTLEKSVEFFALLIHIANHLAHYSLCMAGFETVQPTVNWASLF